MHIYVFRNVFLRIIMVDVCLYGSDILRWLIKQNVIIYIFFIFLSGMYSQGTQIFGLLLLHMLVCYANYNKRLLLSLFLLHRRKTDNSSLVECSTRENFLLSQKLVVTMIIQILKNLITTGICSKFSRFKFRLKQNLMKFNTKKGF